MEWLQKGFNGFKKNLMVALREWQNAPNAFCDGRLPAPRFEWFWTKLWGISGFCRPHLIVWVLMWAAAAWHKREQCWERFLLVLWWVQCNLSTKFMELVVFTASAAALAAVGWWCGVIAVSCLQDLQGLATQHLLPKSTIKERDFEH